MARKFLILTLVLLVAMSAAAKTGQRKKPHKAKPAAVQPAPEPVPTPAPPPAPLTPEQGPSLPPEVSFQGGQLMIVARNSTLGDVLTAVKQRTGAAVEMPAVSSERVVGRFGPGAPRDVMAQLLNGSRYDYVLLGSAADPGALKRVVLIARANGPEPAAPQPQGNQQGTPNLQAVPDIANDEQDDNNGETPAEAQAPEQEEPQPEQPQTGQDGPPIKTPEQLLRELQRQQQQQQQNPAPPGAPPPQ